MATIAGLLVHLPCLEELSRSCITFFSIFVNSVGDSCKEANHTQKCKC